MPTLLQVSQKQNKTAPSPVSPLQASRISAQTEWVKACKQNRSINSTCYVNMSSASDQTDCCAIAPKSPAKLPSRYLGGVTLGSHVVRDAAQTTRDWLLFERREEDEDFSRRAILTVADADRRAY